MCERLSGINLESARKLLSEARDARARIDSIWTTFLESEPFDVSSTINASGEGRIDVVAYWDATLKQEIEVETRRMFRSVAAALDDAFTGAAAFNLQMDPEPLRESHRMYWCDTAAEWAAVAGVEMYRGLRPDQIEMIRSLQPFALSAETPDDLDLKVALAQLRNVQDGCWGADDEVVAVWVHDGTPAVESSDTRPIACTYSGDGLMFGQRTVATFKAAPDARVTVNPGCALDLVFTAPPYPRHPDDFSSRRSQTLLRFTEAVIGGLERSMAATVGGSLRMGATGQPDQMPRWSELVVESPETAKEIADALTRSDIGLAGYWDNEGNLTVLLSIDGSVFARPVSSPRALDESLDKGPAAENAALLSASIWGLPDLAFDSTVVKKGSGTREISDGVVLAGDLGLVLQVKSRQASSESRPREEAWVEKHSRAAYSQALGTFRERLQGQVELTNRRQRLVRFDGSSVTWVAVVIIDHADPPEITVEIDCQPELPCVVLSRRDWDFLFDHLRSTAAVVDYVHRIVAYEPSPLDGEPLRYFELARADASVAPSSPSDWTFPAATRVSWPRLPSAPPNATDPEGHAVFRVVLEDVAESSHDGDELQRIRVLAAIDRAPLTYRAEVGRKLLLWLEGAVKDPEPKWQATRMFLGDDLHLLFSVFPILTPFHQDLFYRASAVRHSDHVATAPEELQAAIVTVAVLLTPRFDQRRAWDTTVYAFQGDLGISELEMQEYRQAWGPPA